MFKPPGSLVREFRPREVEHPFFKSFFLERLRLDANPECVPEPSQISSGLLQEIWSEYNIPIVILNLAFRGRDSTQPALSYEGSVKYPGVHWVDMREVFADTNALDFRIYRLDSHPNASAHNVFASVLAEYLESNNLLGQKNSDNQ